MHNSGEYGIEAGLLMTKSRVSTGETFGKRIGVNEGGPTTPAVRLPHPAPSVVSASDRACGRPSGELSDGLTFGGVYVRVH